MHILPALRKLAHALQSDLRCRGCLGPLEGAMEAGLCGHCWEGLLPLPALRCPTCALEHPPGPCPEPVDWLRGDALWDYRGGRPPLGALLVPGIKRGEWGWRKTLLERLSRAPLPEFCLDCELVTSAPPTPFHRLRRGFDLAEEAARTLADRLGVPYRPLLGKGWRTGRQGGRSESQRRRLPRKAIHFRGGPLSGHPGILLVDDVWTTGTTLLRCSQALREAGAGEIRVLALFRAL
nr:phosphoribosyltransferase family protein [uncultured Holophaga sp.]